MSTIQAAAALYQLQQLDLELERLSGEQQTLLRSLREDTTLNKARADQQNVQRQLQAALLAQKEAELTLDELSSRLSTLEQRIYSGVIKNPKELNAVQQEVQHLRMQQSQQEEKTLELMDAVETLSMEAQQKNEDMRRIEQDWQQRNAAQLARRELLESKAGELRKKREAFIAGIDSELLKRYDMLMRARQGRAVSRVEQQSCQWCRVMLTPSEMQRVRSSQELQTCSNCGRILYYDR